MCVNKSNGNNLRGFIFEALRQGQAGAHEHRRAHCEHLWTEKLTKKLILGKLENRCGAGLLRRLEGRKTDEKADKISERKG